MRYVLAASVWILLAVNPALGQDLGPEESRQRLQDRGHDLSQLSYQSAILNGDAELVDLYIEAEYDPRGTLQRSGVELSYLVLSIPDRPEVARVLLENGADPNERTLGSYLLHDAIPHLDPMRLLLKYGADPSAESAAGFQPIHMAVQSDTTAEVRVEAVKLLLRHGANVDAVAEGDGFAATPLLMCAIYGRPEVAKVLLENGAAATLSEMGLTLGGDKTVVGLANEKSNHETAEVIAAYQ